MANPLTDAPPADFRLREAPLERVLAAIQFPAILKIAEPTGQGVAPFQDRIRSIYPNFQRQDDHTVQIQLNPNGELQSVVAQRTNWRFFDRDRMWRVTLSPESLSLETMRHYTCRDDFLARLAELITATSEVYSPSETTRLGFRYLNVFGPKKMARLDEYVHQGLRGLASGELRPGLAFASNVSIFGVPEGTLAVKHGFLREGGQHEFMEAPVPDERWYLDLDAWTEAAVNFEASSINDQAILLTDRICSFFNWAMTPTFMDEYRAE